MTQENIFKSKRKRLNDDECKSSKDCKPKNLDIRSIGHLISFTQKKL